MEAESIFLALRMTIVGISVVFGALVMLVLLLYAFQWLDRALTARSERAKAPKLEPTPAPAPAAAPSTNGVHADGLSPELVVIIATAAAVAVGQPVIVHRIRYRSEPFEPAWARQGRLTIMASHTPKR